MGICKIRRSETGLLWRHFLHKIETPTDIKSVRDLGLKELIFKDDQLIC